MKKWDGRLARYESKGRCIAEIHTKGILKGRLIELDRAPDWPDGSAVRVTIERQRSAQEMRRAFEEFRKLGPADPSLGAAIAEGARELRAGARSMDVSLMTLDEKKHVVTELLRVGSDDPEFMAVLKELLTERAPSLFH